MKTPMQELIQRLEEVKNKIPQNLISEQAYCSGLDKCIAEATLLLEKEKEVIMDAYDAGLFDGSMDDVDNRLHKNYYNEAFNTKEK